VDLEDTAGSAEAIVETAEEDAADLKLTQRGGAHDAGLHRDVEVEVKEDGWGVVTQDSFDGDEFSVTSSLQKICTVGICFRRLSRREKLTQRERLVSFMPRPMISPL
jgi:hypothetical protein